MKVGDRVKRIIGGHKGMKVGDTDIISYIHIRYGSNVIDLEKYGIGHSPDSLEVTSINWKKRLKNDI